MFVCSYFLFVIQSFYLNKILDWMIMYTEINFDCQNVPITFYGHNPLDDISTCVKINQAFYEITYLDYIATKYPEQKTILDIGANIGNHTVYFANFMKYTHIHAFEPHPKNFEVLYKNTILFREKVTVHPVGLSNASQHIRLYSNDTKNSGAYTTKPNESDPKNVPTSYTCPFYDLDSLHLHDVTFMKIDVEEHELEVLEGARKTILQNKPIISVENLYHLHPWQFKKNICYDFFDSIDYVLTEENVGGHFMDTWEPK